MLTVGVTVPGTVKAAAQRQGWSKIARITTVSKEISKPMFLF